MKILVTGANGYIGNHVVSQLLDMGHYVCACDINTSNVDARADIIDINIFYDITDIYTRLGSPDVCIHLAWRDGFQHNSPNHLGDLPSHYRFLNSMIEGGLKHLVVMGSMHEVGYWEGAIDENTPCNPLSMYGIAKNALRQAMIVLCGQKNVVLQWIRAYYIVGDDLRNNSTFSKLCQAEADGKETFPFTTGKTKYDFLSIDELAKQISSVASQTKVNGIINCCSGKPISLAEKVESYIKEHGLRIKLEYGAFPDRPYDSPIVYGDNSKISMIMNLK